MEGIASWLSRKSIPDETAREYVARMFAGLTSAAVDAPEETFQSLSSHHATAGGTNEHFLKHMVDHEFLTSVSCGLDAVLHRIKVASRE
jgi:pyrroline-5-carboxylate reductase